MPRTTRGHRCLHTAAIGQHEGYAGHAARDLALHERVRLSAVGRELLVCEASLIGPAPPGRSADTDAGTLVEAEPTLMECSDERTCSDAPPVVAVAAVLVNDGPVRHSRLRSRSCRIIAVNGPRVSVRSGCQPPAGVPGLSLRRTGEPGGAR